MDRPLTAVRPAFFRGRGGTELAVFGVVPSALSLAGIVVTCVGVELVNWRARKPAPR